MKFTKLEQALLPKLFKASAACGHDFGIMEECRGAVPVQALAGVVASLVKKGVIEVHPTHRYTGHPITQFEFVAIQAARYDSTFRQQAYDDAVAATAKLCGVK